MHPPHLSIRIGYTGHRLVLLIFENILGYKGPDSLTVASLLACPAAVGGCLAVLCSEVQVQVQYSIEVELATREVYHD